MNYEYKFNDKVLHGESSNIHIEDSSPAWRLENDDKIPQEPKIDLSKYVTHIYDQKSMGISAANLICTAINFKLEYSYQKNWTSLTYKLVIPSRLYIHNLAKIMENKLLTNNDEPTILTCLKVLSEYGYCEESIFDYTSYNFYILPPFKCFHNATPFKYTYKKISLDLNTFKVCLKSGNPIIMGVTIFINLESQSKGLYIKPDPIRDIKLGAHVILIIGYDDIKQTFKFANCWSTNWGKNGFGFIMYDYALDSNYIGDVYTII